MPANDVVFLINHQRIIDGFGDLAAARYHVPLETYCGVYDAPTTVHPRIQKYVLEVKGVPVKMLRRGAVYCLACRRRKSRVNWLKAHERWRRAEGGKTELEQLEATIAQLQSVSKHLYEAAGWPYPAARQSEGVPLVQNPGSWITSRQVSRVSFGQVSPEDLGNRHGVRVHI